MMTNAQIDELDVGTMNPLEAILILAERLGLTGLAQKFEGRCWEHQIDERWWLALNPNRDDLAATDGTPVPGYHVVVKFNGWPAAVFNVGGRGTFVQGEAANEDTFNRACLDAAKKAVAVS